MSPPHQAVGLPAAAICPVCPGKLIPADGWRRLAAAERHRCHMRNAPSVPAAPLQPVPPYTALCRFDFSSGVAAAGDLHDIVFYGRDNVVSMQTYCLANEYAAVTENLPTRFVGKVLGNGTEPCRLAGDVDRLPGALMDWAGKSPAPWGTVADAPFASAITKAGACLKSDSRPTLAQHFRRLGSTDYHTGLNASQQFQRQMLKHLSNNLFGRSTAWMHARRLSV